MTKLFTLILLALAMISCTRQVNTNVYSDRQVGEISTTYMGVIKHVRLITIQSGESLQENTLGIASGGAVGEIIGDSIGEGRLFPKIAGGGFSVRLQGPLQKNN